MEITGAEMVDHVERHGWDGFGRFLEEALKNHENPISISVHEASFEKFCDKLEHEITRLETEAETVKAKRDALKMTRGAFIGGIAGAGLSLATFGSAAFKSDEHPTSKKASLNSKMTAFEKTGRRVIAAYSQMPLVEKVAIISTIILATLTGSLVGSAPNTFRRIPYEMELKTLNKRINHLTKAQNTACDLEDRFSSTKRGISR
jgi:hypothetical protein